MLDDTDAALVRLLHADGRAPVATLARKLTMSASAVRERLKRLADTGVVTGFRAAVDPERVGYPLLAFVRLRYPTGNYKPLHDLVAVTPELLEAHHITGEDCFLFKVVARDMRDLERLTGRLATLGAITTSLVYSTVVDARCPPLGGTSVDRDGAAFLA